MGADIDLVTFALLTTAIATGHLFAGLATGWLMGRKVRPAPAPRVVAAEAPAGGPPAFAPLLSAVESIRSDMKSLEQLCREPGKVPSKDLGDLLAKLVWALDQLHQALSQSSQAVNEDSATPAADTATLTDSNLSEKSHRMGTHAVGNSRIMEWFGAKSVGQAGPQDKGRFPFAVQQLVAPRRGEDLPAASAFEPVQCHDISPVELRYVAEHRPKVNEVVIGLGIPRPVKFLLAEVVDYRSVYMYGRVGYLVTARFVTTLNHAEYLERLTAGAQEPAAAAEMAATT